MSENPYTIFIDMPITEVFDFYDQPVLFIAEGGLPPDKYLVVLHDNDTEANIETWLYVAVSQARLNALRDGAMDLHDAFKFPEDGLARWYKRGSENYTGTSQAIFLASDDLPEPGALLGEGTQP